LKKEVDFLNDWSLGIDGKKEETFPEGLHIELEELKVNFVKKVEFDEKLKNDLENLKKEIFIHVMDDVEK